MAKKLMCAEVELTINWPVLIDENATKEEIFRIVSEQIIYDYSLAPADGINCINAMTLYGTQIPEDPEERASVLWAIEYLENADAQRKADIEWTRTHRGELDAGYNREVSKLLERNVVSFKNPSKLNRILKERQLADNLTDDT